VSTFRFIFGFLAIFSLALLMGWAESRVKHPAAQTYLFLSAIAVLLIMGWCL
jgi:hypothetical protein